MKLHASWVLAIFHWLLLFQTILVSTLSKRTCRATMIWYDMIFLVSAKHSKLFFHWTAVMLTLLSVYTCILLWIPLVCQMQVEKFKISLFRLLTGPVTNFSHFCTFTVLQYAKPSKVQHFAWFCLCACLCMHVWRFYMVFVHVLVKIHLKL